MRPSSSTATLSSIALAVLTGLAGAAGALASSHPESPTIIGGYEATRGAWPWMAGLVRASQVDTYQGQFCGGSLIDDDWVLTAAHCTIGNNPDEIDVIIGVHDLELDLNNGIGERIGVKRIIMHPEYDDRTMMNDLSLIQLDRPVTGFSPVSLVSGTSDLATRLATAIGWGDTDIRQFQQNYPTTLQQVELPIVSNTTCIAAYDDWIPNNTPHSNFDGMICAGYAQGGKDSCSGDSGGPLIVYESNHWELAGITSFGDGCAEPGRYGVYTRVSHYLDFIADTLYTDYFACADFNGDRQINQDDADDYRAELVAEFENWRDSCYVPEHSCGDLNGDGRITASDRDDMIGGLTAEFEEWEEVCWNPEN